MTEYNHGGEGPHAPRTYESAWEWNSDGSKRLRTAEEWLEEEAYVDEKLTHEADDFPRAGILRAIAREIAMLRGDCAQWAEACTRALRGRPPEEPHE